MTCRVIGLLMVVFLTGCQTATFYRQAMVGQWEIVTRRRSVERVLGDPDVPDRLKIQLKSVRELCGYAAEHLGLPGEGQYTRYTELDRPFVVWNVFAAPEFSMEPKSWWYPIVGRLDYQGYFRESLALDCARRLRARGLDVHVAGVEAYSTLGWFKDPVLSTFVYLPTAELAELVFHELAHQRLFIPGDTDVNEAFATAVAREGVRRWLERRGAQDTLQRYLELERREDAVVALIQRTRDRLKEVYAASRGQPTEALRREKSAVLDQLREAYEGMKEAWPGYAGYDDWMAGDLNNACVNAVDAYTHWLPAMELLQKGVGGELSDFYGLMERLRRCGRVERREILEWFEEQAVRFQRRESVAIGARRAGRPR